MKKGSILGYTFGSGKFIQKNSTIEIKSSILFNAGVILHKLL